MTTKLPDEIIEFQPDALEIKNERLPLWIRLCVWLPPALVLIVILWASCSRVDVVVQANGKLVTDRPTIVMKPLERSVIKEINVKIGDVVKPDQILITFDPAINRAEEERLKNELDTLSAQFDRLRAEFDGKTYRDSGKNQFEKWQYAIYRQRQEYYTERINYFNAMLSQVAASIKSKKDSLAKQQERLAAVKKLEDMFQSLYEKKAASLKELIQMSITRMEMEATVDQLDNDLLELTHREGSTQAEKNSFIQEWRNSISEEMVSVDRNLTSTRKDYDKVKRLIEYVYLRAPCEAVVHEIASFSPGSAVREAEALITLIPLIGTVELEAEVRPQDIGKVAIGSAVRVKLNAYPFQKHGTLDGVIRNISENTLQREGSTLSGNQEESPSYYRARITLSGKLSQVKKDFRLIPGMETQCEIKAGRHPVIETLMAPGEEYVPNDISMDSRGDQIIILTGPNMAGKSALLRQTALIVLMAQCGSFVPAASARIGWFDKIFTRVGATDNISRGESTFMVEMLETSMIMHNLSARSLVLLDEIGRGTSTYDGMSIARALVEYIHTNGKGAKTLTSSTTSRSSTRE